MKIVREVAVFEVGMRVRLSRFGRVYGQWLRIQWGNGTVSRGRSFAKRRWTKDFRRCIGVVYDVVEMDGRHPDGFLGVRWEPSGRTAFYSPYELVQAMPWERSKRKK
jgi:hypothetical protein